VIGVVDISSLVCDGVSRATLRAEHEPAIIFSVRMFHLLLELQNRNTWEFYFSSGLGSREEQAASRRRFFEGHVPLLQLEDLLFDPVFTAGLASRLHSLLHLNEVTRFLGQTGH